VCTVGSLDLGWRFGRVYIDLCFWVEIFVADGL
jgi:hypothetical protein